MRQHPLASLAHLHTHLHCLPKVSALFANGQFDAVLHFAAVAYVGESVAEPLRYYKNITANTLFILAAAEQHRVPRFVYSSTCAV